MTKETFTQKMKLLLGLIFIIDLLYMVYVPTVFQKGGVEVEQLEGLFALVFGNVFVYSSRLKIKWILERFLLVLFVTIGSFGVSLFVSFVYIQVVYGDATWHLWENPQRFFANLLLFIVVFLVTWLLTEAYAWMKKKMV